MREDREQRPRRDREQVLELGAQSLVRLDGLEERFGLLPIVGGARYELIAQLSIFQTNTCPCGWQTLVQG